MGGRFALHGTEDPALELYGMDVVRLVLIGLVVRCRCLFVAALEVGVGWISRVELWVGGGCMEGEGGSLFVCRCLCDSVRIVG